MASFYGEILPVVSRAILDSDSEDDDDNEVWVIFFQIHVLFLLMVNCLLEHLTTTFLILH